MIHRTGRTVVAVSALLVALVAGACSDDGADTSASTTSTEASTTSAGTGSTSGTADGSTTTAATTGGGGPCARSTEGDAGTTVTSPGGAEATVGAEEILKDLPADVPLPADSVLDTTGSAAADLDRQVWVIRCTTTTDDPEAAWLDYKSMLDGTGCTIVDQTLESGDNGFAASGECDRGDYRVRAALSTPAGAVSPGEYRWDIAVRKGT